ncbi:MAG: Gfo/Idh/MocA family oxidoreductase [Sphingomonadales bacterium]|nr:Gfo/Idh/MocA family oxidoreductase [Sphingomonadales bacterium]
MAISIGVLGAGHLGKIHMRCLRDLPDHFELKGFYDPDPEQARRVSELFGLPAYDHMEELLDEVSVVDIVTPTVAHFSCAEAAIRRIRHVFIEKPLTHTLDEGRTLLRLATEAGVKVQVGHVERFNPAFQAILPHLQQPRFIEAHRLSLFNPRGTDVSIVLDLMIHDIDVLLSVVGDGIRKISASGVCVVSPTPDIANARIEFHNGCVANITASRLSMKNMRKMRFFQSDAYLSVDFLNRESEILRLSQREPSAGESATPVDLGPQLGVRWITHARQTPNESNAIMEELRLFAEAIESDSQPVVGVEAGFRALEVAFEILAQIESVEPPKE